MKIKILLGIAACLIKVSASFAQPSENAIIQQAETLLTNAYKAGIFSGQVAISHNGKKLYSKELGYADWQLKKVITENTLFNIGSLNKKFTQEIVFQLVNEKKLSYDDNLNKYLDLFSEPSGNKITIRQLIDMKAGLADFLQDPGYFNDLKFKDFSLSDLMQLIKNEPLLFEPGTDQKYSNSGYAVLGAVIEKITGKSYQENLMERIAKPLQLKSILYTKAEIKKQTGRAYGTNIDLDGNKTSTDDVANSTSAGGLYTTIADLLKFTETKLLHAPATNGGPGIPLFAGGSPGWSSAVSHNDKNGFVVVVMANTGDDIAVKIARRLHSIINGDPYPPLEQPIKMAIYKLIKDKGYDYVKINAESLAEQQRLPYDDHFINDIANEFLIINKPDIAINLYKINIELFPGSIYTYDVLAQTFLKTGDKINALKYFKMILTFDPDNQQVKNSIAVLESQK